MTALKVHDFTHSEGIDRTYLRALTTVFENFARHAAIDLSTLTRRSCEIALTEVVEHPWSVSTDRFGPSPYLVVFTVAPIAGQCVLSLPVPTAMRILELRLGGGQGAHFLGHHEPTETDFGVLRPVFTSVLEELSKATARVVPLSATVSSQETNLQFVQIANPQDLCLHVSFELTVGEDGSSPVELCFPQTVTRHLVEMMREASRPVSEHEGESILTAVMAVPIDVALEIPATELMPSDIVNLAAGDVIRLHHPKDRPLDLRAGGVLVARARHGRAGSRVVCSVVEEVNEP